MKPWNRVWVLCSHVTGNLDLNLTRKGKFGVFDSVKWLVTPQICGTMKRIACLVLEALALLNLSSIGIFFNLPRADAVDDAHVTVLGLGHMGSAIASCLAETTVVHAWNRSPRPGMEGVVQQMHSTAENAVRASNLTMVCIDDWEGTVDLLQRLDSISDVWTEDRTVVVFSTYTPHDIQQLQARLHIPRLVGGAVVGVPATICSQQAWILVSDAPPTDHRGAFSTLGKETVLPNSDVGSAALINLSLVLTITFGIAGHELAHLILQAYSTASHSHLLVEMYSSLASEIGPKFGALLLPSVSKAMSSQLFSDSYVPAHVLAKLLGKIEAYATQQLGLVDDNFLSAYLVHLGKVTDKEEGPAAWTKYAVSRQTSNTIDASEEL